MPLFKSLFFKRKTDHGMWSAILSTRKTTSGCCIGTNNNNCQRYSSVCTAKQKQDASGLEKGRGQGKQQQKTPRAHLALKITTTAMSQVPDPSGRNAPPPTHNKNKGRKSAPSATTSTSRRQV